MANEVMVYEGAPAPLTVSNIRAQVNLIQEMMREVMKQDEHYGVIPGTGNKPTLLKAGAEKLILTFRLVPDIEETVIDMSNGHREYRVKVKIYTQNGILLGAGVGSCTTMEGKYRFRTGPVELTDTLVPKEYWNLRKESPGKAQELIGGKGFTTKKNDSNQWVIAMQGDKVEHDNPADYYNTCLKMAKKRALVDACLTVTAASDIFTQDIEDMPEVIPGAMAKEGPKPDVTDKTGGNGKLGSSTATDAPKSGITQKEYTDGLKRLGYSNMAEVFAALEVAGQKALTAKYPTRESILVAIGDKKKRDWRTGADLETGEIEGRKTLCADCGENEATEEYKGMRVCPKCKTTRAAKDNGIEVN